MPVLKKKPNSATAQTQRRVNAEREKTAANVTAAVDDVMKELKQLGTNRVSCSTEASNLVLFS
jgi:hypothetical protein